MNRYRGEGPKLTTTRKVKKTGSAKPAAQRGSADGVSTATKRRKATGSKRRNVNATPRRPFWKRRAFWIPVGTLAFVGALFVGIAALIFINQLPSLTDLESVKRQPGITIKTSEGLTLASYGDVYGQFIDYQDLPRTLVNAVVATEDRRFFRHQGIDIVGIMRAMAVNIRAGRMVQGGSTVTQQVAKNIFLTPERTLKRKLQEMMLAFWLEGHFSKEQIMAIYLNRVYLGAGNYGVDAAARRYFGKSAKEMNLIESAVITGLLKAPSRYSPLSSNQRAKDRARQVLLNMVDAEFITKAEADRAMQAYIPPRLYREGDATGTRYFTDWVLDELPLYLGDMEEDVEIITTLDATLQAEAEDAVKAVMDAEGEAKKASQAALLALSPDGAVKAMVGGRSYQQSQFNRVTQAVRQPGSVFKLFVYLAALEAGYTPSSTVMDAPVELYVNRKAWRPGNFDGRYHGEMALSEALAQSINTVAVSLSHQVGAAKVSELASRLGIAGVKPHPSIALGAVDATLLDMTTAYAHLPAMGKRVEAYGIQEIRRHDGKLLYRREGSGLWVVLRQQVAAQMVQMMQGVIGHGTGQRAAIGRPAAGKTGTSSDYKDAWFIGFVPQLTTGVWVGNDNNAAMLKVTGGNLPAMIWQRFMQKAVASMPVEGFISAYDQPDSLPWGETGEPTSSDTPTNAPSPADNNQSFWDNLLEDLSSGEVEHSYPNQRR